MGVTGSGKSTVGAELAERLGCRFVDGDSLHPAANVAKMSEGVALSDDDRWPWLAAVRDVLRRREPVVVACSALKRAYREVLRQAPGTVFVFLDLDVATATARTAARSGHFMRADMVASQFATLERPEGEQDVLVVDARAPDASVVDAALDALDALLGG
jgi:gluconokinase